MSKESDTELIPSNCETESIRPVAKRESQWHLICRKIIKIALCLFILFITFYLGDFSGWTRCRLLTERSGVYVYDTQQKLEDYYKMVEREFIDYTGVGPGGYTEKKALDLLLSERPLVTVGPFAIFVDNGGKLSVREIQSLKQERGLLLPLVELKNDGQSKCLRLFSSSEKDRKVPRFSASLYYSEGGMYERSWFAVHREDGTFERVYIDTKGIGVFDIMCVFENGMQTTYHLNGLSWEKVEEGGYGTGVEMDDETP